jgi:hypothetical protein
MYKIIAVGAASLLLAACGGPTRIQESATSIPQRDLTLTPSAPPETQFASRIELGAPVQQVRVTQAPKAARSGRIAKVPVTPVVESAPAPEPVTAPAPAPVAEAPQPDPSGRELAPGATVTIVPVATASGPGGGAGADWSEVPAPRERGVVMVGGGHGGRCRGRGRGPVSILN